MNAYDDLSSKDCRSSPYDYLPFEERRTVARWRALTTAIAASLVLGLFGVIAMLSAAGDAHAAVAAAAPVARAAASQRYAATAITRDGALEAASARLLAARHRASVAVLGS